ncbi:SIMPL domain-containing protein, partial [Acinetobacter baumannii]
ASQSADAARDKVLAFLQDNGINAKDIVGRDVHVVDRQATDYAQANAQLRYMVEHTILVRSAEVDKVQKISQMTDKLVAAGVVLSSQGTWD